MTVRPAAQAGLFYPEDAVRLRRTVESCLPEKPLAPRGDLVGVIAPHAGYAYSGRIAGRAFLALRSSWSGPAGPDRIVVIGPSHRLAFRGVAVPSADRFATPLGEIDVDLDRVASLCELSGVSTSDEAHAKEHSIEVELPFLQILFGAFLLVPLVVGTVCPEVVGRVLASALEGSSVLVVSSDLSHFLTDEEARSVDRKTADRIESLADDLRPEEACGAAAINGASRLSRERGGSVRRLVLGTSADATGDRSRVVGYGAFGIAGPQRGGLQERREERLDASV